MLASTEPAPTPPPLPMGVSGVARPAAANPSGARNYYRARYYDPEVGRFFSEDSLGIRTGENRYAYVEGDPAGSVDPSGHFTVNTGDKGFDRKIREGMVKVEDELLFDPDGACCLTHFTRYAVDIQEWLKEGGPPIITSGTWPNPSKAAWTDLKTGRTHVHYQRAIEGNACEVAGILLHEMGHYASGKRYQTVQFSTDCTFGCIDVGPPHSANYASK